MRERELFDFGDALPAATQLVYDFHLATVLPVLPVLLVASFAAALSVRGLATVLVSSTSVTLAAIAMAVIWWALRLPFLPP